MTGPYEYVAPSYWLTTKPTHPPVNQGGCGGAHGFNTETSMGPAVPPIESLRAMLAKDHLWPIDDCWNYHAGGGEFKDIHVFTDALNARFGPPPAPRTTRVKSQLMTYEGIRAMFEAYSRNKYTSTGVIQWMLNNAWPSMIWHLYDFYLRPGGGYFGAKKAHGAAASRLWLRRPLGLAGQQPVRGRQGAEAHGPGSRPRHERKVFARRSRSMPPPTAPTKC